MTEVVLSQLGTLEEMVPSLAQFAEAVYVALIVTMLLGCVLIKFPGGCGTYSSQKSLPQHTSMSVRPHYEVTIACRLNRRKTDYLMLMCAVPVIALTAILAFAGRILGLQSHMLAPRLLQKLLYYSQYCKWLDATPSLQAYMPKASLKI